MRLPTYCIWAGLLEGICHESHLKKVTSSSYGTVPSGALTEPYVACIVSVIIRSVRVKHLVATVQRSHVNVVFHYSLQISVDY